MKTTQALLITALLAACCSAMAANSAPNTYPKERITSAAGACHEVRPGDARLAWDALGIRNNGGDLAQVVCSPEIDVSTNGTQVFGAVLTNLQANNRIITCIAKISGGGTGAKSVTRSVMVGPNTSVRIQWTAEDMGRRVLVGGQAGFMCALPTQTWLSWVWTLPGN